MSSLSVMSRVRVPAGRYQVGTGNRNFGNPSRTVTLTRGFDIGTHCITNQQRKEAFQGWSQAGETHALVATANSGRRFVASIHDGSGKFKLAVGSPKNLGQARLFHDVPVELLQIVPDEKELLKFIPEDRRRDNQPAVSWLRHELIAFANRHGGRLPTEVEWEIAARTADGDARVFDYSTSNGQLMDGARKLANFGGGAPVDVDDADFAPNRRGIWHMTGGVWEATDTLWGAVDVNELIDPIGPRDGQYPVVRGGSSDFVGDGLLAAFRFNDGYPAGRYDVIGGRLAWRSQDLPD